MKEWLDKYNSFNSDKGLLYLQWYEAILKGEFLPPVECSVDPVNDCNLRCTFCNNKTTRARHVMMEGKHLIDLFLFFGKWRPRGVCIAGGGEPTLHPDLGDGLKVLNEQNLPSALLTNGTFTYGLEEAAKFCRWIGISVDSARPETYVKLKGINMFSNVLTNIMALVKMGAREVTYKFLLHPDNQGEVYDAIKLAKGLGCHRIHIRPVSFRSFQKAEDKFDIQLIDTQVERGRKLYEDDRFKIFYVRHKFDKDMHVKFGFKKCLATPLMPIFHANGDMSLCVDRKNDRSLVFGRHFPVSQVKEAWGSERHKDTIKRINMEECPKCTFNVYNKIIEDVVINNKMDMEFC